MNTIRAAVLVCVVLATAALLVGCRNSRQQALEKLAADTGRPDEQVLPEMAQTVWEFTTPDKVQTQVTKQPNGKLLATVTATDSSYVTVLKDKNFRAVELSMLAKLVWRMLRYGSKRNLDELVVLARTPVQTDAGKEETVDLFRVRVTAAALQKVPGWDTADPYQTESGDVLKPEGRAVTEALQKAWKLEVDNSDKVKISPA